MMFLKRINGSLKNLHLMQHFSPTYKADRFGFFLGLSSCSCSKVGTSGHLDLGKNKKIKGFNVGTLENPHRFSLTFL